MLPEPAAAPADIAAGEPLVRLESVVKRFGNFTALDKVSLSVAVGERVVVCGPSGSGKSTLIRCINRLEHPDEGTIRFEGRELVTSSGQALRQLRTDIGMVFQQFNLFPHLSVLTMIVVTHEMGFARRVADRIVFMDAGRIIEDTTPDAFFTAPKSARGADFLRRILNH